jgi:hypothetical protein
MLVGGSLWTISPYIQVLCRLQPGMQILCFSEAHRDTLILQVYDVTKFLEEHPGGDEVLLTSTGEDACPVSCSSFKRSYDLSSLSLRSISSAKESFH